MIQYLIDTNEKRDVVLLYSNRSATDVLYEEVFDEAYRKLGIKTVYAITDQKSAGYSGPINAQMVRAEVPDYKNRIFYISGPQGMVSSYKESLIKMGVKRSNIKIDYFPGFA